MSAWQKDKMVLESGVCWIVTQDVNDDHLPMDVQKLQNVDDARPLWRSPPQPTQSSA